MITWVDTEQQKLAGYEFMSKQTTAMNPSPIMHLSFLVCAEPPVIKHCNGFSLFIDVYPISIRF